MKVEKKKRTGVSGGKRGPQRRKQSTPDRRSDENTPEIGVFWGGADPQNI